MTEHPHPDRQYFSFAQSNPVGPGEGDVVALLRRVADSIEARGPIDVMDICFHTRITPGENDLQMVVYYLRKDRG